MSKAYAPLDVWQTKKPPRPSGPGERLCNDAAIEEPYRRPLDPEGSQPRDGNVLGALQRRTFEWSAVFCALQVRAYRTPNGIGTYNSLCMRCFWTVAIRLSGISLAEADTRHVCGRAPAFIGLGQSLLTVQ